MSKSINRVTFLGNLGHSPQVSYTPNGTAKATFSIALNESKKQQDGSYKEHAEWVNCVAWGRLAEVAGEYLAHGSKVLVEARVATRSWTDDKTDKKVYRTEFILTNLVMLDSKKEVKQDTSDYVDPNDDDSESIPF